MTGGGDLVLGKTLATQITENYSSAAAAVAALNGLSFVSNSEFAGDATLTITVSTTINGTSYTEARRRRCSRRIRRSTSRSRSTVPFLPTSPNSTSR